MWRVPVVWTSPKIMLGAYIDFFFYLNVVKILPYSNVCWMIQYFFQILIQILASCTPATVYSSGYNADILYQLNTFNNWFYWHIMMRKTYHLGEIQTPKIRVQISLCDQHNTASRSLWTPPLFSLVCNF